MLVPRSLLNETGGKLSAATTFADSQGMCERERFSEQPSAAFCTGVLVDWDLVLTAGHCADLLPVSEIAVVPGYYYADEQRLTSDTLAPFSVVEVVAQRNDPPTSSVRLDYAWLRLDRQVAAPLAPAPIRRSATPLDAFAPLTAVNAGGGVPLKIDLGGSVRDPRPDTLDCFVADTDTLHGASGGAAFDENLSLVGVMVRGAEDVVWDADERCWYSLEHLDGSSASEQYTYTHRALEGLCSRREGVSSVCRSTCGEPCEAVPRMESAEASGDLGTMPDAAGCTLTRHRSGSVAAILQLGVLSFFLRRRAARFRNDAPA
ncbi:MAG TPA: serine protease [Polyangiaceae bacterium]